ncbi:MAG: CoA-binding protein [Methanomicrobia archaeon]|nr:CoA-binding protein [Methanomicrobia archaeon]
MLSTLFYPKSIAVIGASEKEGKVGNAVMKNLLTLGYTGTVYPVNPKYETVYNIQCKKIEELDVDLAVIVTPPETVIGIIGALKDRAKTAIIITAGFSEGSEEGRKRENELKKVIKEDGISVLGPNTVGILNTENNLTTTFAELKELKKGNISFISQSGVVLGVILLKCISNNYGINKVASLGNKIDLDEVEFLKYFFGDKKTKVIGMYLEEIKGRKMFEFLRREGLKKPIVILKSGMTDAGKKAAMSHTSSLAGNYNVFRGFAKQMNLIKVETLQELVDTAKTISFLGIPKGKKLGIVHYTGAGCVIASDFAIKHGFELPELSQKTKEKIMEITPGWHRIRNPVDIWPAFEKHGGKAYEIVYNALQEDENIDSVLLAFPAMYGFKTPQLKINKPTMCCIEGNKLIKEKIREKLESKKIPCFVSEKECIETLYRIIRYKNKTS